MGNCSSNKKPVGPAKEEVKKAIQSNTDANKKNEVVNTNKNQPVNNNSNANQKPISVPTNDTNRIQPVLNGIQKIKNFKIKFVSVDESYSPKSNLSRPQQKTAETILLTKSFPAETPLKDCISSLLSDPNKNLKYHSLKFKNLDLKDKLSSKLEDIIKEGDENTENTFNFVYSGLKGLPPKINEYISSKSDYYATINFHNDNNKELVVFKKDKTSPFNVSLLKIYDDIFEQETNENINEHTSFCNGLNNFYISGCGGKGLSKSFLKIQLDPVTSQTPKCTALADMPIELQLHPMIYIPDNYIFVIGGHSQDEPATTNVFYYDIKNNTWEKHSNLNRGRVEHSLCLVNDQYLYAIFGNKNNRANDEKTIEKINLRSSERQWDLINIETFDLSFFTLYSVAQYKNSLILLAVDENPDTAKIEDNNERNLIFNIDNNKLSLYSYDNVKLLKENKALPQITHSKNAGKEIEQSAKLDFFERSFVPFGDNILILSPYNHNKEKTNLVILKDGIARNEAFNNSN
jgi:Kelch motif